MVSHCRWFHIVDGFTLQMVSGVCVTYAVSPGIFYSIFGLFIQFMLLILPLIILIYCSGRIVWVLHCRINGVFTLPDTDTNTITDTDTNKMGLQPICIGVGVCISVGVSVGQCEQFYIL